MSLELLLLRHAKSSWADPGRSDHDRPLNDRGRHAAPLMGRLVRRLDRLPDVILSSDSRRTRETVDLWSTGADWNGSVEWLPDLYHASADRIERTLRDVEDAPRVMIVAHNPGIETFATRLAGTDVPMPTATLAIFDPPGDAWRDFVVDASRTVGVWRPRDLTDPPEDATPARR